MTEKVYSNIPVLKTTKEKLVARKLKAAAEKEQHVTWDAFLLGITA